MISYQSTKDHQKRLFTLIGGSLLGWVGEKVHPGQWPYPNNRKISCAKSMKLTDICATNLRGQSGAIPEIKGRDCDHSIVLVNSLKAKVLLRKRFSRFDFKTKNFVLATVISGRSPNL